MGPKKVRGNMRKIEVPTDSPTEFELRDTVADIQRRRNEREQREKAAKQQREKREMEEARRAETLQSTEEGGAKKHPRTDRNDNKMDTEGGREDTSQSQSSCKKGLMTNIFNRLGGGYCGLCQGYHEELYNNTNEQGMHVGLPEATSCL